MPRITRDELHSLREGKQKELAEMGAKTTRVIIGMGTCGIAAGSKEALAAFQDEAQASNLTDIVFQQTGCMGLCYSEPTVEVQVPDMPTIVYGNVTAEVARRIVRKHIIGKLLINDHIFDKPSIDLTECK